MTIEAERDGMFATLVVLNGGMPLRVQVFTNALEAFLDYEFARRAEAARIANEMEPIDV